MVATTIPQRELRNNVSDILRRVEAGERFTVTVNGRPVAEIGPSARRRAVPLDELRETLFALPPDTTLREQLREAFGDDEPLDPYERWG